MNILKDLFGPGTWGAGGNVIVDAGGVVLAWLGRDHIGRKLAAWWAKHHGPHAIEQQREALRQHEEAKASGQDPS